MGLVTVGLAVAGFAVRLATGVAGVGVGVGGEGERDSGVGMGADLGAFFVLDLDRKGDSSLCVRELVTKSSSSSNIPRRQNHRLRVARLSPRGQARFRGGSRKKT